MRRIVLLSNRGMTLIEVLIATFLFLIISLAMLQTSTLTLDYNMRNMLRDEAVSIGEARMTELRDLPFTDATLTDTGGANTSDGTVSRHFSGFDVTYTRTLKITDEGTADKQVNVNITWTWRGQSLTHTVSTMIRKT